MTTDEFYKAVEKMREAQDQFFTARRQNMPAVAKMWYTKARELERVVDGEIKEHKTGAQQKLF